ncbi:645_t:CDS:2 [Funneliformis mosseae]|uniref:645_t:CDS:1 n=1 Tax=Funneliformis mosseae TaxID=27381 RepID=A0A9N9GQW0_FUNMO|nr:645_t:CDS:2 [Funneliformis mosseae]
MTGRPYLYKNTKEIDIMSIGFAHLETQELTGIIDKPLAIQAGINYFNNTKIDNMWFNVMSQVNFNASMAGFIWENHRYLPVDFVNSLELLPSGKNRVGVISVELSASEEYIKWLHIVSSWKKTGNVSDGFCPICYSSNTAGPDISIAFFFLKGEKREAYILNTQTKTRIPILFSFIINCMKSMNDKNGDKIPRLIIDENNADILISNDCQNWIKVLKQEQGSEVDWECSDIEISEGEE